MRRLTMCVALTSLTLATATACGSDAAEDVEGAVASATSAVAEAVPSDSPSASESTSAEPSASGSAGAAGGTVLTATVGSEEDPNAFVIDLTDASGQKVTTLPAGDYTINVQDPTKIHNWHLKGNDVDEGTTVPEVKDTTLQVSLTAGEYTYICDPHPRMVGTFTVT